MDATSDYADVYNWLRDWPDGCSIPHLATHFSGYRPKNHLTKWLAKCPHLTVFPFQGVAEGAVRINSNPTCSTALATIESMPHTPPEEQPWHQRFLARTSFDIPDYSQVEATSTNTLERIRESILEQSCALTQLKERVEAALEDRGWQEGETADL